MVPSEGKFRGADAPSSNVAPKHFVSGEYRIRKIEIENGRGEFYTLYQIDADEAAKSATLDFGDSMRVRVHYECLLAQIPEDSCGVAGALTSAETIQQVMYFNTNYAHSDDEFRAYHFAEFRSYRGRAGVVEALIPHVQIKPGAYILSIGILPNQPGPHEFYELHLMLYTINVRPKGGTFPALFYPNVRFTNRLLDKGAADEPVTAKMLTAGRNAIAETMPPGVVLNDEALTRLFKEMKRAAE